MGVTGLLPFSKAASAPCSAGRLHEMGVRTVAADAYCWLHRAVAASVTPATLDSNDGKHVAYCLKYVRMLLANNIKPILVFDGRHLPAKAATEQKRRESRKQAKKRAAELMAMGNLEEAKMQLRRSVDITHEMALEVIKECRAINVDCIVAPYEADAQLAYLNRIGVAQAVITEDSDLILFGCDKILFKMDLNGNGVLMESAKLPLVMKCPPERYRFEKFRQMCILSGCDYLASLPGIGLAKARQFINSSRDPSIGNALRRIPSFYNKCRIQVSDEYREGFLKAEATFKHQLVYDPLRREMVALTDVADEGTDPKYCCNAGEYLEPEVAFQLAIGNIDPFTFKKLDDWSPDDPKFKPTGGKTNGWNQCRIAPHASIWHKDYLQNANSHIKVKEKFQTAIVMPNTKALKAKIITTKTEGGNQPLSIEDLSAMYCEPTPSKRKRENLNDLDVFADENLNKTEPKNESSFSELISSISFSDRADEQTSPILKQNRRTYKKMMEGRTKKLIKMSKFQRTSIDESDIVQSKFFSMLTPECSTEDLKENFDINNEMSTETNIGNESAIKTSFDRNEDLNTIILDDCSVDYSINNCKSTSEKIDWPITSPIKGSDVLPDKQFKKNPFRINALHISKTDSIGQCNGKSTEPSVINKTESKIGSDRNDDNIDNVVLDESSVDYSINNRKLTSEKGDWLKTSPLSFSDKQSKNNPFRLKATSVLKNDTEEQYILTPEDSQACSNDIIEPVKSAENKLKKHESKSPWRGCPRPGLSKKRSSKNLPIGQQTLLSNFGFQKKSQLKH